MIIRRMLPADREAVLAIERQSMAHPWSGEQVAAEMAVANGQGWVAEWNEHVYGYAFFRNCGPECELLRLAVARPWRRKGVGRCLLETAFACYRQKQGGGCCFLEVRSSNLGAQQFYLNMKFVRAGLRKGYYCHPVEDAVVLRREWANDNGGVE